MSEVAVSSSEPELALSWMVAVVRIGAPLTETTVFVRDTPSSGVPQPGPIETGAVLLNFTVWPTAAYVPYALALNKIVSEFCAHAGAVHVENAKTAPNAEAERILSGLLSCVM
jgi:hypothetical protein